MDFYEKYSKKDYLIPPRIKKNILVIVSLILIYIVISTLNYGNFIWNDKQFLHYIPNFTGAFGVAFGLFFLIFNSIILSIIHLITICFIFTQKNYRALINKIAFAIILLLNLFFITKGLTTLSNYIDIWVLLDSYIFWSPLLLLDLSVIFITIFATEVWDHAKNR